MRGRLLSHNSYEAILLYQELGKTIAIQEAKGKGGTSTDSALLAPLHCKSIYIYIYIYLCVTQIFNITQLYKKNSVNINFLLLRIPSLLICLQDVFCCEAYTEYMVLVGMCMRRKVEEAKSLPKKRPPKLKKKLDKKALHERALAM